LLSIFQQKSAKKSEKKISFDLGFLKKLIIDTNQFLIDVPKQILLS